MLDGLDLLPLVAIFVVSAAVVVAAGTLLARAGDAIATKTGLGGLFVGMLLMAGATSLPEIVTDVSAALVGAPDLAVGDLFGSSMANMAILAVVDLTYRRRVWPAVSLGHARLASVAIALTAGVVLAMTLPNRPRIGWIGVESIVVVVAYIAAAFWIHRVSGADGEERDERAADPNDEFLAPTGWGIEDVGLPLRTHLVRFSLAALLIFAAAPFVALSADGIAEATGLEQTFLGATLLAAATSLPELVASVAAVRIGAHDLAVGNLFGSNAFNMTILLPVDLAYLSGPVLSDVSMRQLVPAIGAILLMAIALGAIVHGSTTRLRRGEPDAVLLLIVYVGLLLAAWIA